MAKQGWVWAAPFRNGDWQNYFLVLDMSQGTQGGLALYQNEVNNPTLCAHFPDEARLGEDVPPLRFLCCGFGNQP